MWARSRGKPAGLSPPLFWKHCSCTYDQNGTDMTFYDSRIFLQAQTDLGVSPARKVGGPGFTLGLRVAYAHAPVQAHSCAPTGPIWTKGGTSSYFHFLSPRLQLVAKQQGGLLPREWDGREARVEGGGKKGLGMSGHPGWGLSCNTRSPSPTQSSGSPVLHLP